ncbi:Starch-binding associating with outer membrane [Parapedobacter koreensis]|uniref:Starch-binding associating with outer membrane n=1 Tax=Parapedobacter koreensis TaxID=332977 RepID=A0A1H7FNQ5_9SPHI|nr:Starch-binding associating with outer membrane [Parapedobacter koreensis]
MKNCFFIIRRWYFLLLCSSCLLNACSSFLDKDSLTELSSETFWKDENDVNLALSSVYARLQYAALSWQVPNFSALSDEGDRGPYATMAQGIIEPNNGNIQGIYTALYQAIGDCNIFLANVDRVAMDETAKNTFIGEVKFIRALSYFQLSEFFGGVVITDQPLTLENSKLPRSSKEEVVSFILGELDEAINLLPDIAYNGHAVRGTAQALKGKVLLYNGNFPGAATALEQVITGGHFALDPNLKDVFIDGTQESSPEILFSVRFLAPNNIHDARTGMDVYFGTWFSVAALPIQSFVDSFGCIDGLPTDESPLYHPDRPYENRDPRLDLSVLYLGKPWPGKPDGFDGFSYGVNFTPNGLAIEKFLNKSRFPATENPAEPSDQDWVVIRYADVLLMYAEALNEASGPSSTALEAINAVRQRPSTALPALDDGLTQVQLREAIRQERKIELAFEGLRYFDLKRWGTIETVLPTVQNILGDYKRFLSHQYLWPIPEAARNNNYLLEQNPGY